MTTYSQVFTAFDKVVLVRSYFAEPFSPATSASMVFVMGLIAIILHIIFVCIEKQWKGAYNVEEITENINALYFMMWREAIATFKLAEKQAPGNFYCPPHFSNSDIESQTVPPGWYPWIERKVKMLKRKKNYNKDGEPIKDWDLCDILVAWEFGRQIEMKQGKWPKGVLQFSNNIQEQVVDLRDHYQKKINQEIVPIVKELYMKKPIVYFLWTHSAQEWKAWIPGFTSGMWSTI
uniref:Uncharacterized protein n=1 Tax=Romanomermis culicivorax TaxID=13658 RepID=A0A915JB57_ROMCU